VSSGLYLLYDETLLLQKLDVALEHPVGPSGRITISLASVVIRQALIDFLARAFTNYQNSEEANEASGGLALLAVPAAYAHWLFSLSIGQSFIQQCRKCPGYKK